MMRRILGLIGVGTGPYISTAQLGDSPCAEVVGLKEGMVIVEMAETCEEETPVALGMGKDGLYALSAAPFMRVRCTEGNPHMICTLSSWRASAIPIT